jgi:thioredoxin-related protein
MEIFGIHIRRIALIAVVLIFGALTVMTYRRFDVNGTRNKMLMIYGGLTAVGLALLAYDHVYNSLPFETCTYSEEPASVCSQEAQYPALVLFKSDKCIFCKHFSCTWVNTVAKLKENNIPVTAYVIDANAIDCHNFKDHDTVDAFPTIRYYYDADKYDTFEGDRTPENFANFIKTKITDHISPAGATTPKPNDGVEKYANINGRPRERYTGFEPINRYGQ